MFSLACIGIDDIDALAHEVERLKSLHRLQGTELKSTRTKAKPKFVSDLARFLHTREWPVFIELVDKHYLVVASIVERLITLHLSRTEPSRRAFFVKNTMADYIARYAPDDLCPLYAKACQSQNRPDCRKVFQRLIWWSHRSKRDRNIAAGIEHSSRTSLKLFEKLHPYEAVRSVLPIPDRSKRDGTVWLLPNTSSFTTIYGRINRHLDGDIGNVTFVHDEQVHFDEIIEANKALAESLRDDLSRVKLRTADYSFQSSPRLTFQNSKESLGIQAADVIAGFVSRYIYQKLWQPETIDAEHDEAFHLIDRFTRASGVTGINYVAPRELLYALGLSPLANYEEVGPL
ncbi:DUF3800 domain-containing protein [Sinorhizobium medicae]|nr:DUF3800 domain-containing protein [Sinorhizobium medicae]